MENFFTLFHTEFRTPFAQDCWIQSRLRNLFGPQSHAYKYINFFLLNSLVSVAQQITRWPHNRKVPGSNSGKNAIMMKKRQFFKNGPVNDFRNTSFRPTFRLCRVWLSSCNFNFFTNKKRLNMLFTPTMPAKADLQC